MKIFIKRHFPEIILVLVALLLSGFIAFAPTNSLMNWYDSDDGFYYYKVAQNILAGQGVTFDGINPANGFHPLWMVICLVIFGIIRSDLIIPLRVIVFIFGIFQAVSAVVIFRVISRYISKWLTLFFALAFLFARVIFNNIFSGGLESALGFMLLVLVWSRISEYPNAQSAGVKKTLSLGFLAALMVLARLDLVIVAVILGVWISFEKRSDASLILIDVCVVTAIVLTVGTIRTDYTLFPYETAILLTIAVLALIGVLSGWIFGQYSSNARVRIPRNNVFVAGAISGGISAAVLIVIAFGLQRLAILPYLPRSVILLSAAGWIFYTGSVRAWLTRRIFRRTIEVEPINRSAINRLFVWMKAPMAYFAPMVLLLGIYFLWNQINFETLMPISGQIKHWWGTLSTTIYGSPIHSASGLRRFVYGPEAPFQFLYSITYPIFLPLKLPNFDSSIAAWDAVIGGYLILLVYEQKKQIAEWWKNLAVLPLGTAVLFHLAYFYISGYVHMRIWYWIVESLFIFLLLVSAMCVWFNMYPSSRLIRGLVIALIVGTTISAASNLAGFLFRKYPPQVSAAHSEEYLSVVWLVEKLTPVNSVIATPGGGTLSYFIENRRIVNLDGLMNSPEYFKDLKNFDIHKFLINNHVEYIYANEVAILSSPPYAQIFVDQLEPVGKVYGKTLFRYLQAPVSGD